ncbi:universal stress protein [Leptolyngbya sp. KIOST-1]|uniref:universal stress protein n=1 Tax=Leptolyngbya sp. KIOST-1 TaxID=1229172 RepID=UPI00055A90E6|nr:universal stress protein [Leptolyngbya sp. KIOST-1]
MFNHILVAIDASDASQRAFDTALDLAQTMQAELTLVHALDRSDPESPSQPSIAVDSYSMELDRLLIQDYDYRWSEFIKHYDALLEQKQAAAAAVGVQARYLQPNGRAGLAICTIAQDAQVDLIVIGSRSRRGLSEMLLGSVSNYVVHHSPCPVMVIHPGPQRDSNPLGDRSDPVVLPCFSFC